MSSSRGRSLVTSDMPERRRSNSQRITMVKSSQHRCQDPLEQSKGIRVFSLTAGDWLKASMIRIDDQHPPDKRIYVEYMYNNMLLAKRLGVHSKHLSIPKGDPIFTASAESDEESNEERDPELPFMAAGMIATRIAAGTSGPPRGPTQVQGMTYKPLR